MTALQSRVRKLEAGAPDDIARMTDDELRAAIGEVAAKLLADPDCQAPPDIRAILEREAGGEVLGMDEMSTKIAWLEAVL